VIAFTASKTETWTNAMTLTAGGVPGAFEAMSAALAFASVITSAPTCDTPMTVKATRISAAKPCVICM
jgi:hypothetical protein